MIKEKPVALFVELSMNQKTLIWIGLFVGSTVGSYVPGLWGAEIFSVSSVLCGMAGGIVGVWLGFRMGE